MEINEKLSLAFKHYQESNFQQAEADCLEILHEQPDNSEILHLLGVTCHMQGDHERAVQYLEKALHLEPRNADIFYDLGNVFHEQGKPDEALEVYQKAIEIEPENSNAHNNLGMIFHDKELLDKAISHYQRALELAPHNALIHNNLAFAYQEQGELEKAVAYYGRAIQLEPNYADAYFNMGTVFVKEEQLDQALMYFRRSVGLNPRLTEAYLAMAPILVQQGKFSEAIPLLRGLAQAHPESAEIHNNLGNALSEVWNMEEALLHLRKAVQLSPYFPEAYNNLGNALSKLGHYDEGQQNIERALLLNPAMEEALINLGTVCKEQGQIREAYTCYLKALLLNRDNADAVFSKALMDLTRGNFAEGWEGYEWRWKVKYAKERKLPQPLWKGEPLGGKILLVYTEQGIGDEIMFASCIPQVLGEAKLCVIEADERLIPVFERSFPGVKVTGRLADDKYPFGLPRADFRIASGSLPKYLRPDIKNFPQQKSYLVPDMKKIEEWKTRYAGLGTGLNIGISWRGGSTPDIIRARSVRLKQWAELFSVPGVHFINLQYGDCTEELQNVKEKLGVDIHAWEDQDPLKDLDGFAARIAALDLVISVDNSTVHMAGALGVPVWVLLPSVCEWRWMEDFQDTPWYQTVRLFRQKTLGDWDGVLQQISQALKQCVVENICDIPIEISYKQEKEGTGQYPKTLYQGNRPKCAVIMPVGPGHELLSEKALTSVHESFRMHRGIFSEIIPFIIDDREGKIGRSRARNTAVAKAAEQDIEWTFFIDADDVMALSAFEYVSPYLADYEAIWGAIWPIEAGEKTARERPHQKPFLYSIHDVLSDDPFVTLGIGHFVKTSIARDTPFNEDLDTGEDFDYYLRLWDKYKCIKIPLPFWYHRRGHHSTGPRSATGAEWNQSVEALIKKYRGKYGIPDSTELGE